MGPNFFFKKKKKVSPPLFSLFFFWARKTRFCPQNPPEKKKINGPPLGSFSPFNFFKILKIWEKCPLWGVTNPFFPINCFWCTSPRLIKPNFWPYKSLKKQGKKSPPQPEFLVWVKSGKSRL